MNHPDPSRRGTRPRGKGLVFRRAGLNTMSPIPDRLIPRGEQTRDPDTGTPSESGGILRNRAEHCGILGAPLNPHRTRRSPRGVRRSPLGIAAEYRGNSRNPSESIGIPRNPLEPATLTYEYCPLLRPENQDCASLDCTPFFACPLRLFP